MSLLFLQHTHRQLPAMGLRGLMGALRLGPMWLWPHASFGAVEAVEGVRVGLGCGVRGGGLDWEWQCCACCCGPIKLSGCVSHVVMLGGCSPHFDVGSGLATCPFLRRRCSPPNRTHSLQPQHRGAPDNRKRSMGMSSHWLHDACVHSCRRPCPSFEKGGASEHSPFLSAIDCYHQPLPPAARLFPAELSCAVLVLFP
jgi:hypothetical protein